MKQSRSNCKSMSCGKSRLPKSLAEFAATAANKLENILCRGVYLAQNTSQAASVEFVRPKADKLCARQTAKSWRKSPKGFFDK